MADTQCGAAVGVGFDVVGLESCAFADAQHRVGHHRDDGGVTYAGEAVFGAGCDGAYGVALFPLESGDLAGAALAPFAGESLHGHGGPGSVGGRVSGEACAEAQGGDDHAGAGGREAALIEGIDVVGEGCVVERSFAEPGFESCDGVAVAADGLGAARRLDELLGRGVHPGYEPCRRCPGGFDWRGGGLRRDGRLVGDGSRGRDGHWMTHV